MGKEIFRFLKQKDAFLKILELSDFREVHYFYNKFQKINKKNFTVFYIHYLSKEESIIFFYYFKILYSLELYPIFIFPEELLPYFHKNLTNLQIQYLTPKRKLTYVLTSINCFLIKNKLSQKEFIDYLSWLCNFFDTYKLVYFESEGGIFDKTGQRINLIHLLASQTPTFFDAKSFFIFEVCKKIISLQKNQRFNIAITSCFNFISELFTVAGKGTYICKGSSILSFDDMKKLNQKKLYTLIENAFKRKLKKEFIQKTFTKIFLEENYRGCALLIQTEYGFYLSKFAVGMAARGEGIGTQIWQKIKQEKISLFWRSKINNSMNKKYIDECEGFQKKKDWFYFWFRVGGINILKVIEYMENLEIDFQE